MFRALFVGVVCFALCLPLPGQSLAKAPEKKAAAKVAKKPAKAQQVDLTISIGGKKAGVIRLALDAEKAPKTVESFVGYVKSGHFDGTIFHRVIDNFMIQGGGYTEKFEKKPTKAPIQNEADNGLKNQKGTVAMARTSDPHSASAQFFINVKDNDFLDHKAKTMEGWGYCVFGRVVSGMNIVDKIRQLKTGAGGEFDKDVPQQAVVITKATVR